MSLREKAREVKAAGEAERGNFTPHGKPLEIYQWWAKQSNPPARENFCHFWRVVVLWAPLYWLADKVDAAVDKTFVQVGAGLAILVAVAWLALSFNSVAIALGALVGASAVCAGIFTGVYYLNKHWQQSWTRAFAKSGPWIAGLAVVAAFVLLELALFTSMHWWLALLVQLGVIAAVAAGVALISLIANLVETLRAYNRKKRAERRAAWIESNPDGIPVSTKGPSRVSRFFSGLGDFLVLLAQIVRVKKWKICPFVEIPNQDLTSS